MEEAIYFSVLVLLIVVIVLTIVVATQARRFKRFEARVSMGGMGVSVDLYEAAKREVARASIASLSRLARIDRQLIEFWERERFLKPEDSERRFSLFQAEISDLEQKLAVALDEDKYQLASQLRTLYLECLRYARMHWASSPPYQAIRARVMEGLERIEGLGNGYDRMAR